ncbi:MAG: ion transporter [Candidatus Kaiserbacteria bacterium]|nr:ion transporter [Candidatus Kaiserbacteria bacterium]
MKLSKKTVLTIFENPKSPYFSITNDVLAVATIVSVFTIVLETVPSLSIYSFWFHIIDWTAVTLFTLEYCMRLWSARKRSSYAFSFFGVIDLLAILPTFIGLGNLMFLKSARVIRIIRFLRIVRLTKLSHLNIENAEETLGIFGFNIALYACALLLAFLSVGALLHIFVTSDGQYWSVPAGMYWTFSLFIGGLPAPIPPGTAGTIVFIIAKFLGMALFGLLIGVIGKIFNQLILGKK